MAETTGIVSAFALAISLNANEEPLNRLGMRVTDMLNESGAHHRVTHTVLPDGDVSADIEVNCGELLHTMETLEKSPDLDRPQHAGTRALLQENIFSINNFILNGGSGTVEHPAVEANLEADRVVRTAMIPALEKVTGIDSKLFYEFTNSGGLYNMQKWATEDGQRETAVEEDRPYVRSAKISCLMM